jgi:hypothetical protein
MSLLDQEGNHGEEELTLLNKAKSRRNLPILMILILKKETRSQRATPKKSNLFLNFLHIYWLHSTQIGRYLRKISKIGIHKMHLFGKKVPIEEQNGHRIS